MPCHIFLLKSNLLYNELDKKGSKKCKECVKNKANYGGKHVMAYIDTKMHRLYRCMHLSGNQLFNLVRYFQDNDITAVQ